METVTSIWEWFASFPVELAVGAMSVVILLYVVTALIIVFWRHNPKMSVVTLVAPLGLYGVAWLARLVAEMEAVVGSGLATGLWIVFSLLMLTSLIWAAINLIRVLANK